MRSPLILADYVISLAKGRNVVEIGTRNGDVSKCIAHHARKFTAVEMEVSYCKSLTARGLSVMCKNWETVDLDVDLPAPVDVVMWWVWPPTLSEKWLRQLWQWHQRQHSSGHNTTVLVVHDGHIPEDMRFLPLLAAQYRGEVDRVFFDEGGAITSRHNPSYAHPNQWRPGRWGVLHVARFELGPGLGPLPPALQVLLSNKIFADVRPDWDWPRFGWRAGEPPPGKGGGRKAGKAPKSSQS
jgi:hypothetical protein